MRWFIKAANLAFNLARKLLKGETLGQIVVSTCVQARQEKPRAWMRTQAPDCFKAPMIEGQVGNWTLLFSQFGPRNRKKIQLICLALYFLIFFVQLFLYHFSALFATRDQQHDAAYERNSAHNRRQRKRSRPLSRHVHWTDIDDLLSGRVGDALIRKGHDPDNNEDDA